MRSGTPRIAATSRSLAMLEAVIADGGRSSVSALARDIGMPVATAHRQIATLVDQGYLVAIGRGHVAGPRLLSLLHHLDEKQVIANVAAPVLHRLATRLGSVVQLGTFENEMVTYRIKTGQGSGTLFTKVGMQLEAYCSGIGKVLLASLPRAERAAYLAGGPFVPLTGRTIVDPAALARELDRIAERGWAIDDREVADDIVCLAVPVRSPDGRVPAAISFSRFDGDDREASREETLALLHAAAAEIEAKAFSA